MTTKAESPENSRWKLRFSVLQAGVICAATLLAYFPSLANSFIWDDYAWIVKSPIINTPDALRRYWFTFQSPDYFPFIHTLFWVQWRLWGPNAFAWHLTSILLHMLTALTAWRLLRVLAFPGAWIAALIFAIHPVNVEAVAWVYQQRTILPFLMSLLSIMAYLRAEDARRGISASSRAYVSWYSLSLFAFILAMLSKVSVTGLPVVLLGTVWRRYGRIRKTDILRSIPFFVVAVGLGILSAYVQIHRNIGSDIVRTDSFFERLLAAAWAVWFYLFKAMFPHNLMFVYPRWEVRLSSITAYLPLLALVCCLWILWRSRRAWRKPVIAGFVWFIVMLFPVLGFVNIYFMRYSLVADHWQYCAILGPIAVITGLATRLASKGWRLRVGVVVASLVAGTFGFMTWAQQAMYRDEETLWRETLDRNPSAWMAHNNLGLVLAEKGRLEEAMAHYAAALRIKPDCPEAHVSLAASLIECGRVDEALSHLSEALTVKPDSVSAHYNMGRALAEKGRLDEAAREYLTAIRLNPYLAEAYTNLGVILLQKGRRAEAIRCHRKAIALDQGLAEAYNNLGVALASQGDLERAESQFRKALSLKPNYGAARRNLEMAKNILNRRLESGARIEADCGSE